MKTSLIQVSTPLPGVKQIVLNRPEKRNALSLELLEQLSNVVEEADERVLIFQGAGPVFCAGLDLEEAQNENQVRRGAELVARMLEEIYSSNAVTIAAVHGAALAGGAGLVAACDLAVMSNNAQIGFPETRRGLVAALVSMVLRRRLTGRALSELLLLGESIKAERALEIGLVQRVVPESQLQETALQLAQQVLKGAPSAIVHTKGLIDATNPDSLESDLVQALEAHLKARYSSEATEGIRAFLEKREPSWAP